MTTAPRVELLLDHFLAEGPDVVADRVIDAALLEIDATTQQPDWFGPWRFPNMRARRFRAGIAVLILAIGGTLLFANLTGPNVGMTPSPSPLASPSPSRSPSPSAPARSQVTFTSPPQTPEVAPTGATDPPDPLGWSGPIRLERGPLPVLPMGNGMSRWSDARDVEIPFVDILDIEASTSDPRGSWRIWFAERPPLAAELDPAQTLISYGLVFETTGDGNGDYVVGINNDAPNRGDRRVWLTDVATGITEEQVGPPYGFPIDFMHPDEADESTVLERDLTRLIFGFVLTNPPGLSGGSPFYVWSSVTDGSEVVAWDYAPDASWLVRLPGSP